MSRGLLRLLSYLTNDRNIRLSWLALGACRTRLGSSPSEADSRIGCVPSRSREHSPTRTTVRFLDLKGEEGPSAINSVVWRAVEATGPGYPKPCSRSRHKSKSRLGPASPQARGGLLVG